MSNPGAGGKLDAHGRSATDARIRDFDPARPADRDAVASICLATGDAGSDASAEYADPRILTERYALPYLDLEPRFVLLAEIGGEIAGYVLGTPDTTSFARRFEARPSILSAAERRTHAANMLVPECIAFPAHLHVDLLPAAQGHGVGRRLVAAFERRLTEREQPPAGVHLVVDPANTGALAFYPRLGYRELRAGADGVVFGTVLTR